MICRETWKYKTLRIQFNILPHIRASIWVCMQLSRKWPVESSLCHLIKSTLNRWAIDTLFWRTQKSVHQYFFDIQISLCKVKRLLRNARDRFIRVPASHTSHTHIVLFSIERWNCYWNQGFHQALCIRRNEGWTKYELLFLNHWAH